MRIRLFLQRLALDFELHDAAFDFVDLRGQRINFHTQAGGGFIDKVDGFVGQEPVGDIALREHRRRNDCRVFDAHAVVHFVAFF